MINRICQVCNKEFKIYPSDLQNGVGKYCSHKCYWISKRKHIIRQCYYCRKTYDAHSLRDNSKFCSRICYLRYNKKKAVKIFSCQYCGKTFHKVSPSYHYKNGQKQPIKFCSKECVDKARIGKYINTNSPNWVGGLTSLQDLIRKSTDYATTREICFNRDNYKSILSGKNGKIEHHHLVSMAVLIRQNHITKANWRNYKSILFDPNNTVTLREAEHKLFHSIQGKVTTPQQFNKFCEKYKEVI